MRNLVAAAVLAALAIPARAEEKGDLAAHMKEARIPLERGIASSKSAGTPISAKYEVEDGKLQGFKAVSAMPSFKDGRPVAEITLMKGSQSKTVSQPLE